MLSSLHIMISATSLWSPLRLGPIRHYQLYMLLLGITATSLLSTPMVILLTHKLLHGTGGLGPQYQPVASACTELVRKVGGFYGTAHAPGGKEGLSPAW